MNQSRSNFVRGGNVILIQRGQVCEGFRIFLGIQHGQDIRDRIEHNVLLSVVKKYIVLDHIVYCDVIPGARLLLFLILLLRLAARRRQKPDKEQSNYQITHVNPFLSRKRPVFAALFSLQYYPIINAVQKTPLI